MWTVQYKLYDIARFVSRIGSYRESACVSLELICDIHIIQQHLIDLVSGLIEQNRSDLFVRAFGFLIHRKSHDVSNL